MVFLFWWVFILCDYFFFGFRSEFCVECNVVIFYFLDGGIGFSVIYFKFGIFCWYLKLWWYDVLVVNIFKIGKVVCSFGVLIFIVCCCCRICGLWLWCYGMSCCRIVFFVKMFFRWICCWVWIILSVVCRLWIWCCLCLSMNLWMFWIGSSWCW